jgi:hypothetical protein
MSRLQNYINTEETERAKDDGLIDTNYKGNHPSLKSNKPTGTKGKAHFVSSENTWRFQKELTKATKTTPATYGEWYRVNENNLDFER